MEAAEEGGVGRFRFTHGVQPVPGVLEFGAQEGELKGGGAEVGLQLGSPIRRCCHFTVGAGKFAV